MFRNKRHKIRKIRIEKNGDGDGDGDMETGEETERRGDRRLRRTIFKY